MVRRGRGAGVPRLRFGLPGMMRGLRGERGPSLTLRVTGDDAGSAGRAGSLADASGYQG